MKKIKAGFHPNTIFIARRVCLFVCFLFLTLLLVSCSDSPTGFSKDDLTFEIKNNGLSVFNNSEISIFYFAVERGVAASILWIPASKSENEITPNNSKLIPFSEIFGFDMGEEILFFYWESEDPESSDIKNLVINTGN